MSEEKRSIEIVASYSGKIGLPQYSSEDVFFSLKECIENCDWTDKQINDRQNELSLICYEKFINMKQETRMLAEPKEVIIDPVSVVPEFEEIRQKAIKLITEQGKWFQDNGYQKEFRTIYKQVTGEECNGDLQILSFGQARYLDRKLGARMSYLQKNGKKIKEKSK